LSSSASHAANIRSTPATQRSILDVALITSSDKFLARWDSPENAAFSFFETPLSTACAVWRWNRLITSRSSGYLKPASSQTPMTCCPSNAHLVVSAAKHALFFSISSKSDGGRRTQYLHRFSSSRRLVPIAVRCLWAAPPTRRFRCICGSSQSSARSVTILVEWPQCGGFRRNGEKGKRSLGVVTTLPLRTAPHQNLLLCHSWPLRKKSLW